MNLSYVANIAEIFAGLAILFSVVKAWPAITNLNQLVKKDKDWHVQLIAIQSGLAKYTGNSCPELPDVETARDQILTSAISSGASDIHIEVKQLGDVIQGCVRFRVDGQLKVVCSYDSELHADLINAFKIFGSIPTDQSLGPMQGRGRFDLNDKRIDFRLQITPTQTGDYLSARILDPSLASMPYSALGIGDRDLELIKKTLDTSEGLLVFGGPTGSGKTVSFYTSINQMDDQALRIISVEDPIEVEIPGIVQLGVQDRPGHHFDDLMGAVSRSDPDVLLIGEIRSEMTAHYCFRFAVTGHFVISTIHSNNVIHSLAKLHGYGDVREFPDITLVNQRLARRLCVKCSTPATLLESDVTLIDSIVQFNQQDQINTDGNFRSPVGCEHCINGYKGRVAGYEVLNVNQVLMDAMARGRDTSELWSIAISSGTTTVGYNLLQKVSEGETSLAELRRVAGLDDIPQ